MANVAETLKQTPLHDAHVALGAKMVPFAGYAMPVQYRLGVLGEHLHTRSAAGLFDVSHMGQAAIAASDHESAARALEALVPADILNLKPGQQRYTQLLDQSGGILDDLMVTRPATAAEAGHLYLVVNASTKEADLALIEQSLPTGIGLVRGDDRALLALQGPSAVAVLERLSPEVATLPFMGAGWFDMAGLRCHVSRSGYTGEDGFEISCKADDAQALWAALTAEPEVQPIGLGARDSLRLEAGLCLYGHDIDPSTTPVEAGLTWSIQKRRREEGGFPGAERIRRELEAGPSRVRVGIAPDGRAPAREGAEIGAEGRIVGRVTSGGFGPSVGGPVAMGYVEAPFAVPGTPLELFVRGTPRPARVAPLPFVTHRYHRKPKA